MYLRVLFDSALLYKCSTECSLLQRKKEALLPFSNEVVNIIKSKL
jgi:hypothetical protein